MAECFEDLESVRAAFGLWPGIRFRCAVCGQPHGITEIHEWVRCATHLGREWGVEAFPRAEKWLWLRGWVDYTFKPPLIIAITRPEEVQKNRNPSQREAAARAGGGRVLPRVAGPAT